MKQSIKNIFNYLASMNLAISLLLSIPFLILLHIACSKLTFFKQWNWFHVIASTDFYHSLGFKITLILFCINLLACCLKKLPNTIMVLKNTVRVFDETEIASSPLFERINGKGFMESMETFSSLIAIRFNKPIIINRESSQLSLFAEKGRFSQSGFYFAHVSIIIIVCGIILSTSGYEYSVDITKGQVLNPSLNQEKSGTKLDFSLLCEDFKTIYDAKNGNNTISHQSILSIIKDGEKIKTQEIKFGNAPLRHSGIDIYQDKFNNKEL